MNETALRVRYATIVWSSAIAAVFAVVVALLLLSNFVRRVPDPLTTLGYVKLKEDLRQQPDNADLKQQIRQLDLALREDYFRRRQFTTVGTLLFLGGIVISVAAAKLATQLYRRLPQPSARDDWGDPDARIAQHAVGGVSGLAALLAISLAAAGFGFHSVLTKDLPAPMVAQQSGPSPHPSAVSPPVQTADTAAQPLPQPRPESAADPAQSADSSATAPPSADDFLRNWPRFRGPMGTGISAIADLPTVWDGPSGKGIRWKSPVPLPGNSSPIVWKDAVYVTGADETQRELYCFDAEKGALRWKWAMPIGDTPADPPEVTEDTGFAAPTAATDGLRVFVMFATGDLAAVDFAGRQVWLRRLGLPKNSYGHASSLVVAGHMLLIQFDQGAKNDKLSRLLALNTASGETVWEAARDVPNSWTTPIVVDHQGQSIIVTCGDPWVIAYNLPDGKEVWRVKALRQDVGPSPVAAGGLVYAANEFPGVSAIRLGGQGDVTATHVAWFADSGVPDTSSPLVAGDLLLLQASFGTLTCYDAAKGGDPLWEEELDDNFCSSPGLAGQHVYLFAESGKSWVIRALRDKCERVAENDLGEECVTSPAFAHGRIYIRGKEHLFCLGSDP